MKRLASLSLLALLSGCASLSESECRTGDWYGIGLRDGQAGRDSQIAQHAEACAELGIKPRLDLYNRGRTEGLRSYCTPENGYRVGLAGSASGNICPAENQAAFLAAYQRGYERYRLQRDLDDLDRRIEQRATERGKLEEKIATAKDEKDRRRWLRDLDDLNRQQSYDRRKRDDLRWQLRQEPEYRY
ncbi:DUF2799 domain-containing protein [Chitinilyticum piscinae]|uniref:DUF2799 domain-containing protein n=1 Tax=Chitinilyticum piscinae TaxID=2866724 RepID=A0A8J7FHK8_9NEIS|nr:DUF2799 domain-containing protein [Chitinilyticum piscinae]MBE9609370.1 DUF2799 domain-containing protein [Chitinilyticum piscinae]